MADEHLRLSDLPLKRSIADVVWQFGFASLLDRVRFDASLVVRLQAFFGGGRQHFAINWFASAGALVRLVRGDRIWW